MSNDKTVFVSDNAEVLAVHEKWKAGIAKFKTFLDAMENEFDREALFTRAGASGHLVVGFRPKDGDDENPPNGLRFDRTRRYLVPHKSTTLGKKLVRRFQENSQPKPVYPGMPEMVMSTDRGIRADYPGFEEKEGRLYAVWGCSEASLGEVDRTLWERVPLSAWYAMHGD